MRGLWAVAMLAASPATGDGIPRRLATSHALPLDKVPEPLRANVEQWRALNPSFSFQYFDDAEQAAFMRDECAAPRCHEAYEKLSSGAGKADLFRVAWMYYKGGWWFDSDLKPGDIADRCDLESAHEEKLFILREPKHGHVRFMLLGGAAHPLLLATLRRQIDNVFAAKALPAKQQPRTLHVTGPFTLGKTLCDPFRHATVAELFGTYETPDDVAPAAADIAEHCDRGYFNGRRRQPRPDDADHSNPSADWAATYGAGSPLSFRFDGCKGQWHRPGARMVYADVLAAMNVTHHLKITA